MSGAPPRQHAVNLAVAALGVLVLAWRLVDLDLAPFINDEPQFLAAARDQLATGRVLTRSTIVGTSGYYYGGAIFWFYGALQWLGVTTAQGCLRAMTATVTVAQLAFGLAVARHVLGAPSLRAVLRHERGWLPGVLWLLIGASPHQFFWSRLAWDQLTNAVAFAVVAASLGPASARRAAGVGILLGFGLSSHPMLAPFALFAGLFVVIGEGSFAWKAALSRAVALGGAATLVLLPWLRELWLQRQREPTFTLAAPLTLERAAEVVRAPGMWGISYFFDQEWSSFLTSAWGPAHFEALSTSSTFLWAATATLGVLVGLASSRRRLALFTLLVAIAYPVFYASRGIPIQPHYQFPTGWVPLVGVALVLSSPLALLRRAAVVAMLLVATWQLDFIHRWKAWIASREGTRGPHFGVPIREQQRIVEEVCARPGAVWVSLEIVAFAPSFEFLASTLPDCAPRVRWCGAGRGCAPSPGEPVARVRYAAAEGARLAVSFSP